MKKILLAHPYRHHSYHSLIGIQMFSNEAYGCYGYYDRGDLIDKLVRISPLKANLLGYSNSTINNSKIIVRSDIKTQFLLAKANHSYENKYLENFEKFVISQMDGFEVLHVLQDYCNGAIREAHRRGLKVVYEQIQPFDHDQVKWLKHEVDAAGFSESYIKTRFPQFKIDQQLENLEMASVIISASKASEISLKPYTEKKIYTFPYGANIESCTDEIYQMAVDKQNANPKLKILYIGAINLIKGVRYIIEAAQKLVGEPFNFTFIGKPTYKEDISLIMQIESLPNCEYVESIPHTEIDKIYQLHDIFVFQGLCEGFGMVTLEAMSNGLPCLVSEGGCGIVTDGKDGYINKNCDTNALVGNLLTLSNNRNLLIEMGRNAKRSVLSCSWDSFSDNIAAVYRNEMDI